jgi:ribosomal protein L3 glutamine methyltransferase
MDVARRIDQVSRALERAGVCFGHGTDNAVDEAAWLVLHAIGASIDGSFRDWARELTPVEETRIVELLQARIEQRVPLAYLTGTTRFAGLEFETSPAALVPRSPLGEMVLDQFEPWVRPERVKQVLDLCTGGGCIAVAIAVHMPWTRVTAADISPEALAVARRNVQRHAAGDRVVLVESDLFQSIPPCRYDLIVTNPPYVPAATVHGLPGEYRAEPELGLVSGADGLDACLEILQRAADYLAPAGVLICEVGESAESLEALLPDVPFIWLEFSAGGAGVFQLTRDDLVAARPSVEAVLEKRLHVT